ncbi:transposase [Pirellulaceae bacterium SH501]
MGTSKDVFYLFAPHLFANPSSYSCSGERGQKNGGQKDESKSSHQFFWDATWNNIVTYCTPGITNAVAEGINSKNRSIQRRTGGYRSGGLDLYPQ